MLHRTGVVQRAQRRVDAVLRRASGAAAQRKRLWNPQRVSDNVTRVMLAW
jgi:hypothetical protein